MDDDSNKIENIVKSYSRRTLAFKALRQLRVEVDKIDNEDRVKKKRIKIIAVILILFICFVLFIILSKDSDKGASKLVSEGGYMGSPSGK